MVKKEKEREIELYLDELNDFLDTVEEDDKAWVALSICRETIFSVCDSHMQELGFMEVLKDDLKQFFGFMIECDKKEDKKSSKKKK